MLRDPRRRIVVIGGGQAGGRLARLLANDSERFEITLVCGEPHAPYERPPLSKDVLLGKASLDTCLIWPGEVGAWRGVERRLGVAAESVDRAKKTVRLASGEHLPYDVLVLATGSGARKLVCAGSELGQVHYLRTIDDALRIAGQFTAGKRLLVAGGGFVGLEVAASARRLKLDVTVVEASDRLLARVVPPEIAAMVANAHRAEGVRLEMAAMVERFIGDGRGDIKAAQLSTGEIVPCDIAVVGIGAKPETDLAVAAGLEMAGGIRVDASLRTSDPAIFACGDVATFFHPLFDSHIRVEAWQNAEDHASIVASVIRGEPAICGAVPWFWSDQYDLSLQIAGLPHLGSSSVMRRLGDDAAILFHLGPTGRLFSATGLGTAQLIGRDIRIAKALIAARARPDPATLRDPNFRLKSLLGRTAMMPETVAG